MGASYEAEGGERGDAGDTSREAPPPPLKKERLGPCWGQIPLWRELHEGRCTIGVGGPPEANSRGRGDRGD